MDLTQVLIAATNPNPDIRTKAEAHLKHLENENLPQYLTGLCIELGTESKPQEARQLAGLTLKNTMDAKSEQQSHHLAQRWLSVDGATRSNIKGMLLQILGSAHKSIRSTAAMVIAKIAAIEVPKDQWNDIINILDANIKSGNPHLKQSSFESLGFICEEIPEHLQKASNLILNAIATGMDAKETNNEIKLAATTALVNSIEFVKANMAVDAERNLIMQMVFSVTQSADEKVRVAAYQCLVEICSNYYEYLPPYMGTLFELTSKAIMTEAEEVAQQAIEFWSTVCDVELALLENEEYEDGKQKANYQFVKKALQPLIPCLLSSLTKQNEDVDDDTWNVAMAAGTCLGLCAQVTTDDIVQHVLPFVSTHVNNPDWRFREAATLAFACILDGPDREKLAGIVSQAFSVIIQHMKDSNDMVKDTAAWTIGRICLLIPEVITQAILPNLMAAMCAGLKDVPKVAANICWAIHNLASAVEVDDNTSSLSPYFEQLMRELLTVTTRSDVTEGNLLTAAYEAINSLISSAAPDVNPLIQHLLPMLVQKLQQTLVMQGFTAEDRESVNEVQALLCGALTIIIQKLDDSAILPHADTLMELFLRVLSSKNATVHEEALMAVGAIANRTGKDFEKYMQALSKYLMIGLMNAEEYKVCSVAVGLVGDVCRALEGKFCPYSDEIMKVLLDHLQNTKIERSVKTHIISCLGDIALAVGGYYERYMEYVMKMLMQASQIDFAPDDWENVDYLQSLREAILEAYTGILQGLADHDKAALFLRIPDTLPSLLSLFDKIAADVNLEEDTLRNTVGLLGDLASRLGAQVKPALSRPSILELINQAKASKKNDQLKETAQYAIDCIHALR